MTHARQERLPPPQHPASDFTLQYRVNTFGTTRRRCGPDMLAREAHPATANMSVRRFQIPARQTRSHCAVNVKPTVLDQSRSTHKLNLAPQNLQKESARHTSSSVQSGRCSATTQMRSSRSTLTEKTAILRAEGDLTGGPCWPPPKFHLPPAVDELHGLHSQHGGDHVVRVVLAAAHLHQAVPAAADEHQAPLGMDGTVGTAPHRAPSPRTPTGPTKPSSPERTKACSVTARPSGCRGCI